ncbi:ABC transporter permease [Bacillus thuringiensis serovar kyushuensis]|uniref:ABC transporter permease n=1 Tax=Bacillus TaxID=1386 RepID=UPI000B446C6A|nr:MULTISPECIES: FtsX-like permease family protein [Bacillus]MEC2865679.1 FtsX-like permease family protein [Bacillus cereus]MCI4251154.1 FtsX-like permease family protein [Bacillus sp. CCB-MMP212]OTZ70741.1 ABC transporter permease [Bacillus thuringiensis serovar tohokuensis]OTZ79827.1 ABC transporter permease [Bacillus thuringiensis serovar kyushuensis]OUB99328.1 ABC transporter permease [Bacillus thuringiensis serovar indiana]
MIGNYKQLSRRYLKGNKKRTILTLIGIVLSVSLISTIGLFMNGTQISQIENTKKRQGYSFHAVVLNYDESILKKIKYNPQIESFGLMSQGETVQVGEAAVKMNFADDNALEFLKYSIIKGRLPSNDQEVAVDPWVLPYIKENIQIGDSFELNEKKYKLVGFLSDSTYTQENKVGRLLTYKSKFSAGEGKILVGISSKANFNEVLEGLKTISGENNINISNELIQLEKPGYNNSIMATLIITISIVVIATIVVIYNAFQISVVERTRQFGLLRSIGATRKQIRQIVLREATFLAVIAIPIGIICSLIALASLQFTFSLLMENSKAVSIFYVDWNILLVSSIITLLSVIASSLYPAYFAGKISPLLAISSRLSIKKEQIKKQKNSMVKKPLSIPLSMAMKNVKRNKNRYTITILSIIISSVLFITFSYLMSVAFASKSFDKLSVKSDITIKIVDNNPDHLAESEQVLHQLKSLENISKVYEKKENSFETKLKDVTQSSATVKEIENTIGKSYTITIVNNYQENKTKKEEKLTLQVLAYGFITVISLISSVNILNTITISIMTRRKELAALKSIGMSQKDLKKMITYEALIYGFSGSLQGIFFGCILSYIIYLAISDMLKMTWTIPYEACIITFVSALIISYLSVLNPLKKIQQDNIIDNIREQ